MPGVCKGDTQRFGFRWPCQISELECCESGEKIYSPIYRTVHNNVGFDWKMYATRQEDTGLFGVRSRGTHMVGVGYYIEFQASGLFKHPPQADGTLFIELKDQMQSGKDVTFKFEGQDSENVNRGSSTFLPWKFEGIRAEGLIQDDVLKFGVFIEIPTAEFTYSGVLKKEQEMVVPQPSFTSIFSQCQVFSRDSQESIAAEQILNPTTGNLQPENEKNQRFLDFKIFTKDEKKIACHGVVLNENCPFFSKMFSSKMKEAGDGEITFRDLESDVVLELVHHIYREQMSESFSSKSHQDLDLYSLLNGTDRLVLPGFKLNIETWLVEQQKMEVGNAAHLLILADKFDMKIMKEATINFAAENLLGIRRSEGGKDLDDQLLDEILEVNEKRMRAPKVPRSRSED